MNHALDTPTQTIPPHRASVTWHVGNGPMLPAGSLGLLKPGLLGKEGHHADDPLAAFASCAARQDGVKAVLLFTTFASVQ
jgi:hypothetical protein